MTTTTTTTLPPQPLELKTVETIIINPSAPVATTNGSDSKASKSAINSLAFSYGMLASGETSQTLITYLKVPYSNGIQNIKIGLINTGDIDFSSAKFGVAILGYIDYNMVPTTYFNGVNEDGSSLNVYNVNVGTRANIMSQYVYLNVFIPRNQSIKSGTIRYKWWFDFA